MKFHYNDLTIFLLCVINIRLLSNTHFRSERFYNIALNERINAKDIVPCKGQFIADIVGSFPLNELMFGKPSYSVTHLFWWQSGIVGQIVNRNPVKKTHSALDPVQYPKIIPFQIPKFARNILQYHSSPYTLSFASRVTEHFISICPESK